MNKNTSTNNKSSKSKAFPIVGIGASAGGIEAVSELLHHLAPDTGMAFVYIQHLDPTHESMLSSILAKTTRMKVLEAEDLLPIEKNHVYIIPPNKDMGIVDGVLTLIPRKAKPSMHMPIDKFFVSLAEKQKEGSIGIVLSGNASDGTFGLRAIKIAGGITIAQDDSAKFKSMPKSAITEGVVDMILPPKEIAAELNRISKNTSVIAETLKESSENIIVDADEELKDIIQILKKSTGVDFTHYKTNTIKRRILRRMLLFKLETLQDYLQYLKKNPEETKVLYRDMLIHVTSFFRDPDALEYIKKALIPRILKSKSASEPLRIWVPACASGEEAYSLAIIFMEVLGSKAVTSPIQIFATDLSEVAIAKARMGIYSKNELEDVSHDRIERFFTKIDGHYRILKSIRDLCVFAPHNIFRDPPFSRLDVISCCNLLIYVDSVLQKRIIATFHYVLNNNGYLILGKSETPGSGQLFLQLEKKYKIYSKKANDSGKAIIDMNYRVSGAETAGFLANRVNSKKEEDKGIEKTVEEILLNKYTPASVVVNSDLEIVLFRGSTSLFLEPSPGKASLNLLKMAKPGLAFELRNAIHKCDKTGRATQKSGLEVKNNGIIHQVSIEVSSLQSDVEDKFFLIVFQEATASGNIEVKPSVKKDSFVKQLQAELQTAKEDMRSVLEEQEASMEELQSANEEIVSSNEELQSINEELETSKEEIESTNEELMTINSELQIRNEQLSESYEYSEAVFDTIREAVLVLDHDFRVRLANKAFYKIFHVNEAETEGTLIYELGNKQWNILKLRELLEEVIPNNIVIQGFEVTHNFPIIGEKVMLLNARRIIQKIHEKQLILLAIEDITEQRRTEKLMAEREAWFRNMADNAPVMMWIANADKERTFFNHTWLEFTGWTEEHKRNKNWEELILPDDRESYHGFFVANFDKQTSYNTEYRLKRYDGEYRWIFESGKPAFSTENTFTGFIGSCTEIHDKKIAQDELELRVKERTYDLHEINEELRRSNNELQQFAYVASHDLQEPLRKIMTFCDRLQNFKELLPDYGKIYIDKIITSSQRMAELIDDLLDFSRISKINMKFVPTDLNKILKKVYVDFDLIVAQKKGLVEHGNLPEIQAIPVQMEQLFHNLLSNSLKFSKEEQPPVITITSRKLSNEEINERRNLEKNNPYVELIFKDNGIGFDPQYAEQIFVIFQRLNDKHTFPGTGIGLALCRRIVENHGGQIYAISEEKEGAEFHVILPVHQRR